MTTINLTSSDGSTISAYVAGPADSAAGIVVIQEIFGVNAHIRSVADRFAGLGYRVIAPSFYDRVETGVDLDYTEAGIEAGIGHATLLNWNDTMADVQAAIDWLGVPSGVVGYCWGGSASWLAASKTTAAVAVGYYGSRIPAMLDDSPTQPIALHFGEHDASIPASGVEKVKAAYPDIPVFTYDCGHGFNCDVREDFDKEASDLALSRTLDMFVKHLPKV